MIDKEVRIPSATNFLSGGGEMGQRIREFDWSSTPLGPIEGWPQSLRTCVRIMLSSRQPIWIGWGKELIKLYNDPYQAIVGGKHPWALGRPASVVWKDIWRDIKPMLDQVMEKDTGTYVESQLLIMERYGYPEETYYTFSYTPIPGDDGGTAGMICANTDDTDRIISERQLKTLTLLGKTLADSRTEENVVKETISTLEQNPYDFPFAIFYKVNNDKAVLAATTGIDPHPSALPKEISLDESNEISLLLKEAVTTKKLKVLEGVSGKFDLMAKGAWEVSSDKAIILPVIQSSTKDLYGFLVFGFNPYRLIDEAYEGFFSLVADQIATSFADVRALEVERKRAEALAEIDHAKTTFFSNISHEFRTPLTLLLGPIEDALRDQHTVPENKLRMEVAYRNGLRMQKLVNTLLEFSRIEAGRAEGAFSAVDICTLTKDLASTFRSAIERAGMKLSVHCERVKDEVYVDTDMWEKIILNLISNAFKYTKEGKIGVMIRQEGSRVKVAISDTGVGIPSDQLSKIFDRFHRVENIRGRSQEGTGIGLAMVKELVKMHQGTIEVESTLGKGSVFTVTIPVGRDHLPAGQIIPAPYSTSENGANTFIEEALRWLPEYESSPHSDTISDGNISDSPVLNGNRKYHVLLADDNADMRDYVSRLLSKSYKVTTVQNGKLALEQAQANYPDLIVSDVMMPEVDGFTLVEKLKADNRTKNIPVILLSARAGEEATIEGLERGADDYLVKPFSARELLTRVDSNIKISKTRQAAEENIRNIFMQAPVAACILKGPDHVIEMANSAALELWGKTYEEVIDKPTREVFPELITQGYFTILDNVYYTGESFAANEMPLRLLKDDKETLSYINFVYDPLRDSKDNIVGVVSIGVNVTAQVMAKKIIAESERKFRGLIAESPSAIAILKGEKMIISVANHAIIETWGKGDDVIGKSLFDIMPEIVEQGFQDLFYSVYRTGKPYYGHETPVRLVRHGREELVYYNFVYQPHRDEFGNIEGVAIIATEVTPYAIVKKQLSESEERLRVAIESAEMGTWDFNPETGALFCSDRTKEIFGLEGSITIDRVMELIVPQDREPVMKAIEKAMTSGLTGGHYDMVYELENALTKAVRTIRAKGTVIFSQDGNVARFTGILLDITEQRKAEEVIRAKTKELEFVTNVMPQMVWATTTDGYVDFYNDRWYEYLGHGFEEIKGTGWTKFLHPDDRDRTVRAWKESVEHGKTYEVEYRLRSKEGNYRWFLARGIPMRNDRGEILKWYGSTTDIDERKRASEILEQKIEERTHDLLLANQQLERSNHELEQFAFVTSHDLQEPLRKIQTFSNMLFEKNKQMLTESAASYLQKIVGASKRMSQLINDLLNFSRLSKKEEGFTTVDLNEILRNIQSDFEIIIAQKRASIEVGNLPQLEAIPLQMNQLFYNLMSNALKFTSTDTSPVIRIDCSVATPDQKRENHLHEEENYYQIVFGDNGIGFNQQYAQKIFEIFQRLHGRSQYEGTGIGLALASKIVENHKGKINAYSEEGKGATFYIYFPQRQIS